jgi:hypothetical protein
MAASHHPGARSTRRATTRSPRRTAIALAGTDLACKRRQLFRPKALHPRSGRRIHRAGHPMIRGPGIPRMGRLVGRYPARLVGGPVQRHPHTLPGSDQAAPKRLRRDPRPLRTTTARSSRQQPGQGRRLSPLGLGWPARRRRRDRELRQSRLLLLQGQPAARRRLAHTLEQRSERLQPGVREFRQLRPLANSPTRSFLPEAEQDKTSNVPLFPGHQRRVDQADPSRVSREYLV